MKERLSLWRNRFSQAWAACLTCMVGGDFSVVSVKHAVIAAKTGSIAATIAVLCTFTAFTSKLHKSEYGQAWILGIATAFADILLHGTHYGAAYYEAAVTGGAAALLALILAKRK